MKGVALLVAMASLGVDYSWRDTEDRQREYTIQIEPEFLKALADGEEIHSDVPVEAHQGRQVQRLCIRIGTTKARHSASSDQEFKRLMVSSGRYASADTTVAPADSLPTIWWPAKSNPIQTYAVSFGWQPDQEGNLAYFAQLDPTLLASLEVGDEIHTSIDTAAGRVGRFVIASGKKQLPRVSALPNSKTASTSTVSTRGSRGTASDQSAAYGPSASAFDQSPAAYAPASSGPPATSSRGTTFTPLPSTPDPAYSRSPATGPPASSSAAYDSPRATFNSSDRTQPSYQPDNYPSGYTSNTNGGVAPAGTYGDTGYGSTMQPPVDPRMQPGYGQSAASQPPTASGSFGQPGYQQYPPPAYPQQPNYAPPPNYAPQPTYHQAPSFNTPPDNRVASVNRPTTTAATSPLPAPGAATGFTRPQTADAPPAADKPWWPLMFTTFALFLSIGGNLYLGWTAAEFYSRYRLAVERVRSAGRT